MKPEIEKTIKNYKKIARGYTKKHIEDLKNIKEIIENFIDNLEGNKILDVGCGPGRDAEYFVEKGLDVTGIDLTSKFVKIASERVPKAEFIKMDMRDLKFPANTFNGIWVFASFLHIPKTEAKKALFEFKRVLKPNGLICISVKKGEGEKFVKTNKYGEKKIKRFFAFYKERELKKLVKSCNFKSERIMEGESDTSDWIYIFATPD